MHTLPQQPNRPPDILDQDFLTQLEASGIVDIEGISKDKKEALIAGIYYGLTVDINHFFSQLEDEENPESLLSSDSKQKIAQAYLMAAIAHSPLGTKDIDKTTRGNNTTPYVQHPIRSAIIIDYDNIDNNSYSKLGDIESIRVEDIIVDLCHDLLEDTELRHNPEIIRCILGERIFYRVSELTKNPHYEIDERCIDLANQSHRPPTTEVLKSIRNELYFTEQIQNEKILKYCDRLDSLHSMQSINPQQCEKIILDTLHYIYDWYTKQSKYEVYHVAILISINKLVEERGLKFENRGVLSAVVQKINLSGYSAHGIDKARKFTDFIGDLANRAHTSKRINEKGIVETFRPESLLGKDVYSKQVRDQVGQTRQDSDKLLPQAI